MMFKEMKPGYPLYILDRAQMKAGTGKAVSVSLPHIDTKIGGAATMVVDIVADIDNTQKTFCMAADSDVAYPTGQVIATGRDIIVRELQAIQTQSEQALAQEETHRRNVERCKALLAEFDPAIKERQETEARFSRLENSLAKLAAAMEHFVN